MSQQRDMSNKHFIDCYKNGLITFDELRGFIDNPLLSAIKEEYRTDDHKMIDYLINKYGKDANGEINLIIVDIDDMYVLCFSDDPTKNVWGSTLEDVENLLKLQILS